MRRLPTNMALGLLRRSDNVVLFMGRHYRHCVCTIVDDANKRNNFTWCVHPRTFQVILFVHRQASSRRNWPRINFLFVCRRLCETCASISGERFSFRFSIFLLNSILNAPERRSWANKTEEGDKRRCRNRMQTRFVYDRRPTGNFPLLLSRCFPVAQFMHSCVCHALSIYRVTLSTKQTNWADIVVPIGGDGTFLLTASRACPLLANDKPIVGFNSDPVRSEGRLLLPKQYSYEPNEAVRKLVQVNLTRRYSLRMGNNDFCFIGAGWIQLVEAIPHPDHDARSKWTFAGVIGSTGNGTNANGTEWIFNGNIERQRSRNVSSESETNSAVFGVEWGVYRGEFVGTCLTFATTNWQSETSE